MTIRETLLDCGRTMEVLERVSNTDSVWSLGRHAITSCHNHMPAEEEAI